MAPPRLRLALLLLPLMFSAATLAAPGCNSTLNFDFEVGMGSKNWTTLSRNESSNNQAKLKPCEVHRNMSGVHTYGSFRNINKIFHCLQGHIKEEISLDNCSLYFSYQNLTAHMECPCGNRNDSVSGSLVYWHTAVAVAVAVFMLLVIFLCYKYRDKLTLCLGRCFKRHSQGTTNEQDGTHHRNSSEMQCDREDAGNDQCNPEERHSLLLGGMSDSSPDSANSVVLERRPLNGTPGTPLPIPVTQEQPVVLEAE